jgi:hypothetical protein
MTKSVFVRRVYSRNVTRLISTLLLGVAVVGSTAVAAQWPSRPTPGPKTTDGKPDLRGPTPRTADGKPDLSGVWETIQGRRGGGPAIAAEGTGELPPSGSIFGNVGDQTPGGAPYQPWAAELVKKRQADNSKDNPDAHCLPMGVMQMTSHPYPKKIIQTPSEVIVIYEGSGTTVRELFLDGRVPAKDVEPWWNGYSTGRWEGDTLVVDITGFNDKTWLAGTGTFHTDALHITERFTRVNKDQINYEVTMEDPNVLTKSWTLTSTLMLREGSRLEEYVCAENNIDLDRYEKLLKDGVKFTR